MWCLIPWESTKVYPPFFLFLLEISSNSSIGGTERKLQWAWSWGLRAHNKKSSERPGIISDFLVAANKPSELCCRSKMTSSIGIGKDGERGGFLYAGRDLKHEPEGPDHKDLLAVTQSYVPWWQCIQARDQLHWGFLNAHGFFPHPLIS